MTAQSTGQATSIDQAQVAKEAALIANFYGKRGQLQSLIDHLVQSFALTPEGHYDYANEATGVLLRHFDPPTASEHDTTIIQLGLNGPGAAGAAWESFRNHLEAVFPDDARLKDIWGYTLIYQAELAQDVPSMWPWPPCCQLSGGFNRNDECPQTLAQADMPWWSALADRYSCPGQWPASGDGVPGAQPAQHQQSTRTGRPV